MKLRGRLFLAYAAILLALLGLMEVAGRFWLSRNLEQQMLADLDREARLATDALPADPSAWAETADRLGHDIGDRVTLISAGGRVLGDSEVPRAELAGVESHATRPEIVEAREHGDGTARRFSATIRKDLFYVAHRTPDGSFVRVARSVQQVDDALSAARRSSLAAGGIAFVLAAAVALALAEALSRPIREITDAARSMAGGLTRRIDVHRTDELGTLAVALNDLASGLAHTIDDVTLERNRLAAILAGMVEGVLVVDASGRIVMVNPSLRELFALSGEVAGRTPIEGIRSEALHEAIHAVLAGGPPTARSIDVLGPPDRTLDVRFSILHADEKNRAAITGLVAVFHDVSELKRLEQIRRDFVANASHELRTPVTAILGASETLTNGAISDATAGPKFVELISRNASRLAALVQDLLDLSRLESRAGIEAARPVEPAEALTRAAAPWKEAAASKRLSLVVDTSTASAVRVDPALLDRALTNLVQNAVRYTPEGGRVTLRARAVEGSVRFEVEDTGIGIPSTALPRIFERFYRVDPARSRELGGTGLGLAIVKHAVETMGGQVAVQSTPGKGSIFSVSLPAST